MPGEEEAKKMIDPTRDCFPKPPYPDYDQKMAVQLLRMAIDMLNRESQGGYPSRSKHTEIQLIKLTIDLLERENQIGPSNDA